MLSRLSTVPFARGGGGAMTRFVDAEGGPVLLGSSGGGSIVLAAPFVAVPVLLAVGGGGGLFIDVED